MPGTQSIDLPNDGATTRLGRALAPILSKGDVFLLEGPIGAGKTHFARALIQERLSRAGRMEDVPSPTFTLIQIYDSDGLEIWHADLYRLGHPDEVQELGLEDAMDQAAVLIEWPDRLGDNVPERACRMSFRHEGDGRSVEIAWEPARMADWMKALAGETSRA